MGCFDSVWVPCPRCGNKTQYQTKVGICALDHYDLSTAPDNMLADIADPPGGEATMCKGCGAHYKLIVKCIATVIEVAPDQKKPWLQGVKYNSLLLGSC